MREIEWDKRFLELSKQISTWSKDPSTKCGSVIVRPNNSIASTGFNGFPTYMPDDEINYTNRENKYSRIIHAEMNALIFCQDKNLIGYTVYTYPFESCDRCFVHLAQAGIKRFVSPINKTDNNRWDEKFKLVEIYSKEMNIGLDRIDMDI